jgi:hypothetical protein
LLLRVVDRLHFCGIPNLLLQLAWRPHGAVLALDATVAATHYIHYLSAAGVSAGGGGMCLHGSSMMLPQLHHMTLHYITLLYMLYFHIVFCLVALCGALAAAAGMATA